MSDNDDAAYFQSRAEQEEEAARNAAHERAADIHRGLAKWYRAKASNPDRGVKLVLVRD